MTDGSIAGLVEAFWFTCNWALSRTARREKKGFCTMAACNQERTAEKFYICSDVPHTETITHTHRHIPIHLYPCHINRPIYQLNDWLSKHHSARKKQRRSILRTGIGYRCHIRHYPPWTHLAIANRHSHAVNVCIKTVQNIPFQSFLGWET